tara:strand:+ start:2190 stop:2633 length:444 start_codon:yes stop_codon:yes gene_type:complete
VSDSKTILVLNGPNLNLLGKREPQIYGTQTLSDIEGLCKKTAKPCGLTVDFRQTNSESELIDWIQQSKHAAIIINPAAYTHSSIAIRDSLVQHSCPIVEVHISNIFTRESFRNESVISGISTGVVCGFGANGYMLAIIAVQALLENG